MTYDPVKFTLPGAGVIAVVGRQYETLSDAFIQQWMYELLLNYRVSPDYLLLSAEARHVLYRVLMESLYWPYVIHRDEAGEPREVYPNRAAGTLLTLVVFPGLPDKTLFAASLLEVKEEWRRNVIMSEKRHRDDSIIVPAIEEITRRYGRMGDERA